MTRDRSTGETTTKPSSDVPSAWLYCAWDRCSMMASWFPGGAERPGRCSWHASIRDPRDNTYQEFETWCYRLREGMYCTVWAHFHPSDLWDFLCGSLKALPEPPMPCKQGGCQWITKAAAA